ncbi:MAG: nitroreductase family protein [Thaumarchaeota archaeon]|jgi:nitroreductase|nr:nitroreductase family protein [Candidatus Terraquivivens yellowstonensis]MCL7392539.1 nitroreductase family protein [Candidatus Terraquivivens yellowstonensis]MCL7398054.1 nitroreductase family protein [Candidatus Terraquivivens yellowstonensis]MCL7398684.1 nitroreductase family protein [Candidatus Terraquivivens yellowstonensis]MCL7400206.1 nitroreductase family protein [Candidatus Terraquivivens yellowstonensis]
MSVARSLLNIIYNRRTIRKFRPADIPEEILNMIVEAGQRAPSYYQAYSFILVSDKEKRKALEDICEAKYISNASAIIVICSDLNRVSKMFSYLTPNHILTSDEYPIETIHSIFETGLATQNMIIAAEVLGFGTALLRCVLSEAERVAALLELPKGVIPIVLLCIGEKDEIPPKRPRWPLHIVFHKNKYREPNPYEIANYVEESSEMYDREDHLIKYKGIPMKYKDYLTMKVERTKDTEKNCEKLSKFLRKVGFKI